MTKIWNVKIRQSIKNEFPADPMMQELHQIRTQLSREYKPTNKILIKTKTTEKLTFKTATAQ